MNSLLVKLQSEENKQNVKRTKQRMIDSMPPYYHESPEADAIMQGNATEIERKKVEADDLLDQFYVLTATWGLDVWDKQLALPPSPRMAIERRRQRILAKLNGTAPATIKFLTDILNVFSKSGDARIIEYNSEYAFHGTINAENNVITRDVYKAINEVKPAHLKFMLEVIATIKPIVIKFHAYNFGVPYRITNTFKTDDVKGGLAKVAVNLNDKAYGFDVLYPIANTFVTASIALENIQTNVILAGEYRENNILYLRAGSAYIGEGDI